MDWAWSNIGHWRRPRGRGASGRAAQPPDIAKTAPAGASEAGPLRLLEEAVNRLRPAADTALGFAELLSSHGSEVPDTRRREDIETLLDHCKAVSSLLHELGDLLRIGGAGLQLHEQQIDAADLAEVAMKRCAAAAARHDVTLAAKLVEGIEIQGDRVRLRQALEALVIHAMGAAHGCALSFAVKRQRTGGLAFVLQSPAPAPQDAEAETLLSTPLDQLGLDGLGPAVARRIALRHGGDVTIAPDAAGGTEYCLILPASRVTWPKGAGRSGIFAA